MTTASALELRRVYTLALVRDDLISVYADVRAPLLAHPNYAVPTFTQRLDRHGGELGFSAVVAYTAEGEPVGYAYANVIESGDRWWRRITPEPAPGYTERPAVALKEIGVRQLWRKTGTSRRIHDVLLAGRPEEYVSLMVNPTAGDGKVHRLYKTWGYWDIGTSTPSPESPTLVAMVRTIA